MSTIGDILNRTDRENAEAYWNRIKCLETENKRLKEALQLTVDRWRLIGRKIWDTKVQVSILELARQLEKDVEQILRG